MPALYIALYIAFLLNFVPYYSQGGDGMASYVSPEIKNKFETLSIDLKDSILKRDVHLETLQDLILVLEQIVNEGS